ncbi:putative pilus assembly protein FilE [Acinetobacter sp. VNK23]|uniref:putative pilus assembly protein FilE n=1 Tax=Acinetobacter thutiue TaxID=2998078 RepID=UPI0025755170|nr:putative pilus assembly protein FilE [Acinetobacter thutiue]MDM1021908.1 putative pilus assembly protein FilE [Acinetobacter thutiue]
MQKKWIQQPRFVISLLSAVLTSSTVAYADGFYTIIGPDGRPMIVPKKVDAQKNEPTARGSAVGGNSLKKASTERVENQMVAPSVIQKNSVIANPSQKVVKQAVENSKNIQQPSFQLQKIEDVKKLHERAIQQSTSTVKQVPSEIQSSTDSIAETQIHAFNQVDGIEYVNSEYLEDQEFNLDGKKRFYTMPDGTGRFETIERKKGVSRSVLDKLMNRSQQINTPIVLAASYVRLSAQDLSSAFDNDRCFLQGYTKSIKTLTPQKEVGLWPRKPLKEKFEYELVKLDSAIQYIQVDSYASSNEKPIYYWPLVVFLDEKGCIQEAVSGFKNNSVSATLLQHAAIQGVIKVPAQAHYIMMTPLASAVDVPEQKLSNQGQIKIFALQ